MYYCSNSVQFVLAQKVTYKSLLEHPKWRRKRARILKRDKGMCTVCEGTKDLEAHHTFYFKEHPPPWKYPDSSLLTLCADCHRKYHLLCETEIKQQEKKNVRHHKKEKKPKIISLVEMQRMNGVRVKLRNGEIMRVPV